jgi:hypothetical protein
MITCNLKGGLGNQIFQIFTVISSSIESKNFFKFLNIYNLGGNGDTFRHTYWDTFFFKLKPFLVNQFPESSVISERGFTYNTLPVREMLNRNIILSGYFQSYKYFQKYYDTICKMIDLQNMKTFIMTKINLSEDYFKNTISMHFRLGDYKRASEFHPITPIEYYQKSLGYIQSKHPDVYFNVLYFCEKEDDEIIALRINKLKLIFPNFVFTKCKNSFEDWEQLLLMSCCRHNIIANSSFSWWSAYFNSNEDKIVCYPSLWFGSCANINTIDLCPPDWIKINV